MTGEPQSLALATAPLRYAGAPLETTPPCTTLSIDSAAERDGWGKWRRVGEEGGMLLPLLLYPPIPIAPTIPTPLSLKPRQEASTNYKHLSQAHSMAMAAGGGFLSPPGNHLLSPACPLHNRCLQQSVFPKRATEF